MTTYTNTEAAVAGHTPGPWTMTHRFNVETRDGGRPIANNACPARGSEEAVANMRLIAKAPLAPKMAELLAALSDALDDAIETHIYDREVPDDAPEVALVNEARTVLAEWSKS